MRTPTLITLFATIFLLSASAAPTDVARLARNVELTPRKSCPNLKTIRAPWSAGDQGMGRKWTPPWRKQAQVPKVAIQLSKQSNWRYCVYDIPGGWNGRPAYVFTPFRAGVDTLSRRSYDGMVAIYQKLGHVLDETKLGARPAAVVSLPSGMPYHSTHRWNDNFYGWDRSPPSDDAFEVCVDFVNILYDEVTEKMAWYAENLGLLYDVEAFSFASSVLWDDEMSAQSIEFVDWAIHNLQWTVGLPVPAATLAYWRQIIARADIQAEGEHGVCEVFRPDPEEARKGVQWEDEKMVQDDNDLHNQDAGPDDVNIRVAGNYRHTTIQADGDPSKP